MFTHFLGLEGETGVDCGGSTPQHEENPSWEENHDEILTGGLFNCRVGHSWKAGSHDAILTRRLINCKVGHSWAEESHDELLIMQEIHSRLLMAIRVPLRITYQETHQLQVRSLMGRKESWWSTYHGLRNCRVGHSWEGESHDEILTRGLANCRIGHSWEGERHDEMLTRGLINCR